LANGFLESGLKKMINEWEKEGTILVHLLSSARFLISERKAARCLQVFRVRYDIQGDREKGEKKRKERGKKNSKHS